MSILITISGIVILAVLAALTTFLVHLFLNVEVTFEPETRDRLLAYFFTTIGRA